MLNKNPAKLRGRTVENAVRTNDKKREQSFRAAPRLPRTLEFPHKLMGSFVLNFLIIFRKSIETVFRTHLFSLIYVSLVSPFCSDYYDLRSRLFFVLQTPFKPFSWSDFVAFHGFVSVTMSVSDSHFSSLKCVSVFFSDCHLIATLSFRKTSVSFAAQKYFYISNGLRNSLFPSVGRRSGGYLRSREHWPFVWLPLNTWMDVASFLLPVFFGRPLNFDLSFWKTVSDCSDNLSEMSFGRFF